MVIGGVDPGNNGGLALYGPDGLIKTWSFKTVGKDPDIDDIQKIFWSVKNEHGPVDKFYIEKVHGRPGFNVQSQFGLGRHFGICEAMVAVSGFPYQMVTPANWQKVAFSGIDKSMKAKDRARVSAMRLFPSHDFVSEGKRVPHDGMIDAALIALYGYRNEKSGG